MLTMSDRIRGARTSAGLSQSQLANETGVKRSAVAQWERKEGTHPSVEHLARIAVVTQVRFEWLATGRGTIEGKSLSVRDQTTKYSDPDELRLMGLMRKLSRKKRRALIELLDGH